MLWLCHAAHAGASRIGAGGGEVVCSWGGAHRVCSPPSPQEAEDGLGGVEAVSGTDLRGRRDSGEGESPEKHGDVPREGRKEEDHRQGSLPQLQWRVSEIGLDLIEINLCRQNITFNLKLKLNKIIKIRNCIS